MNADINDDVLVAALVDRVNKITKGILDCKYPEEYLKAALVITSIMKRNVVFKQAMYLCLENPDIQEMMEKFEVDIPDFNQMLKDGKFGTTASDETIS